MKIRKGKNIYFKLSVLKQDSSPEDFSGASDIKVTILEAGTGRTYVPLFGIDSNILSFEFPGSKNKDPGTYGIYLSYTKPNPDSVTGIEPFFLDKPNVFTVVSLTGQEDLKQAVTESLDMITLSISGAVNAPRDGIDGITPHIGLNRNWYIGDEDTGVPTRGPAFTYDDFTRAQIMELQRPATEAQVRADLATAKCKEQTDLATQATDAANQAVDNLDSVVEEQNKKIASLEGLVMSLFNPFALKHYDRVVADGGTIYASYKELSDWFDQEGITQEDMDGTGEFQLIRIDPYYTGVRIDPSSTSNITYVNKVYNINKRWDMVKYAVNKPMELTKDYCLRKNMYDKGRGIKTIPFGFHFNTLSYKVKAIPEQLNMDQLPGGHYPNVCPVIGMFYGAIGTGFNYAWDSTNAAITGFSPKIGIRTNINDTDTLRQNVYINTPGYPDHKTPYQMEFNSSEVGFSIYVNGEQVSAMAAGESDEIFLNKTTVDNIGLVSVSDKGYTGGSSICGSVKFKDFKFRFKEYINPDTPMLLPLDGPANEPFTDEEIKYLEEQQLNNEI